jgi:hypothetical protein
MSNLPPTACKSQPCPNYAVKHGRCADHQPEAGKVIADSYKVKSQKPFFKLYKSARWAHPVTGLRAARLRGNPICQVLDDAGVQCTSPATIGHHLIDPKVGGESAFWDAKNIVCVCAHHHPGGQEGERLEDRRNFADTILFGGKRIVHPKYAPKTTAQGMVLSVKLAE